MDKKSKRILIAFGVALLVIIIIEIIRPKPLDWRESYLSNDKVPFGCFILNNELNDLFSNTEIENINQDPFEFLRDSIYKENSMYFFVNSSISFDKRQFEKLSNYAKNGNTIFISARDFGSVLLDSIGVDTYTYTYILEEEVQPELFNSSFNNDTISYNYKKGIYKSTFTEIDTINTKALGYYNNSDSTDLEELNFIKVKHGEGTIFLHTMPEAFSNYYFMEGNQNYIANVLSYIDPTVIYWDDYLKSGRKVVKSPMRFVLNQAALKWSYYIAIIGLLFFVIFKGKREQRIINVVEPLENSTIEFTKTIGNLHFQQKDYGNIIAKKITYFLERVRSQSYLNTNDLDDNFIKKLAQKSSNSYEITKELIDTIKRLKIKSLHNEKDLIDLNKKLEEFTIH